MIKKHINQNDILNFELLNILDYSYIFNNEPIKRIKTKPTLENSLSKLKDLKHKIEAIQDCDLKKNTSTLLNKMLKAIKIEREKIYITNVVNYRPPNNRKPEKSEINRYSEYLKEHISIIDPQILILMGSTAMEALFGGNKRISKERGQWKEIIIKQKTYKSIITFHPAYLLRQPDQKKFSWEDLKIIHKKIDELNIEI